MSEYLQALTEAMTWLGEQPDTLFLGQSVADEGTPMRATFKGVDSAKLLEMPVAENLQLGISIGLALEGFVPISAFPRFNFLILAMDQLVNHLDRLPLYSSYKPKVIIRTAVGRHKPLDPGPQHQDDFSGAFARMLKTVEVLDIRTPEHTTLYKHCYRSPRSTIMVEYGNQY